jgi:hypothetical protein
MRRAIAFGVMMGVAIGPAWARDPVTVDLTVDGQSASRGFSSVGEGYNWLTSALGSSPAGSAAIADINLRGVPAVASFAANSPVLVVRVPSAGVNETFAGSTRAESQRLFEDWLKGGGSSQVNRVLSAAVRTTPVDPIAGNPNSALSRMVASDFNRALEATYGERTGFGLGARFGSFTAGGYRSNDVTLPLDYSWRITDRDTVALDVPLSYTSVGGATSYSGNLGVLYRRQVLPVWTLQGSVRVGAAGSSEMGSAAGIYGLGINSTLQFQVAEEWRALISNSVNYVASFGMSLNDYTVDYNVRNAVFRNGVVIKYDPGIRVHQRPLILAGFVVDTRFTGTEVYIRNYQEFGIFATLGREARGGVGITLMTGDRDLFGVSFNMGVKF